MLSDPRSSQKGGKRAYNARLWKDRSGCQSRHSIASAEYASLTILVAKVKAPGHASRLGSYKRQCVADEVRAVA
jgi:hypothetical protein